MGKTALITGITGQDGAYLAEYLLNEGYVVHGIKRRTSQFNTQRIDHLYKDRYEKDAKLFLHYGDLTDSGNLYRIIYETMPDEIYNLGAMSHVHVSFETPDYTGNAVGLGALRILESVRMLEKEKKIKVYQASTSELYGNVDEIPQNELTRFSPRSPYAAAKLYAYWSIVTYREAYGLYACNGILFNHESPLRGETFLTRKVTRSVAKIALNYEKKILLGNLNAERDWGHAKDYVKAMYLMMQQEKPDDYVIATGISTSVRDFVRFAFQVIGIDIEFVGAGLEEKGIINSIDEHKFQNLVKQTPKHLKIGQVLVMIHSEYFRPAEVDKLIGDATKAKKKLGWAPIYSLEDMIQEMVISDLTLIKNENV